MLKGRTLISRNSVNSLVPSLFSGRLLQDDSDEENDKRSSSSSTADQNSGSYTGSCSPKPLLLRFPLEDSFGICVLKNFRAITQYVYNKPLLVLDLDNTVQEPGSGNTRQLLGSDQWFEAYLKRECTRHKDFATALNLTLAVYDYIQIHSTMKAVEPNTPSTIQIIKDNKIPILALTTRGGDLMPATLRQLGSLDISFENGLFANLTFMLEDRGKVGSRAGLVTNNIIFCNGRDKGACLKQVLDRVNLKPPKIVFVDDKLKNVQQMQKMCDATRIPYLGLHYTYLADKLDVDLAAADAELANWQRSSPKIPINRVPKSTTNSLPRPRNKSY